MNAIQVICLILNISPLLCLPLTGHELLSQNQLKFIEMAEKARVSTVDFCYATRSDSVALIDLARNSLIDNFEKCSNTTDYRYCYQQIERTLYRKVEAYDNSGSWWIDVALYNHDCSKPDKDFTGRSFFSLGELKFSLMQDDDGVCGWMGQQETRKSLQE